MIYIGLEIGLDVQEKFRKFVAKNVWEPCTREEVKRYRMPYICECVYIRSFFNLQVVSI